jgi:phosphoribosyl 1,2-cyclic phosphodiesterase
VGCGHEVEAVQLTVLGSGSRGNAVLVESGGEALLVDAGFSLREILRRCAKSGRDPSRVRGLVLTHEHGDHARGAARAAAAWGVPVAASRGTLQALRFALTEGQATVGLAMSRPVRIGRWSVTAYPTAHDAAEPVIVVVEDVEGRRVGVAFDVGAPTTAVRLGCRGLDALVLETNHDDVLLRSGDYPPRVRERIAGSGGHLSNRQAAELVAEAGHSGLGLLVLGHLSDRCNRAELAMAAVRTALRGTQFAGRIVVAGQTEPTPTLEVGAAVQLALPLPGTR